VNLKAKQRVTGVVPVSAVFTGVPPARVLLYLDGRQIDHDTSAPYLFKWDTRRTKDGVHQLTLAGRAPDGRVVRSRVQVVVVNNVVQPPAVVSSSLADGQTVSGTQHWLVDAGGTVAHVDFAVDGTMRASVAAAPYAYDWDTGAESPGAHRLTARAVGADGATVERSFTVTVAPPAAP
jgi:hypothetical protein